MFRHDGLSPVELPSWKLFVGLIPWLLMTLTKIAVP